MRTPRFLPFIALAILTLSIPGCQYRGHGDTYVLVAPNLSLPYWQTVQEGFRKAADEYGVSAKIVGPGTYDPKAEADAFSDAAAGRPAGILVSVADANLLRDPIDRAVAAGIPVITVDSDDPHSRRLFFIGTNNLEAGRLGGQELAQKLGGKGNVVFYTIQGQPNLEDRLTGYRNALEASPDIHLVDVYSTESNAEKAAAKTEEYLSHQGPGKVDAFVSLESTSGPVLAQVFKQHNITDRTIIAMDADPKTLAGIRDGIIDSTISQKPFTMGFYGLRALDDIHHFKPSEYEASYTTDIHSPYPAFVDTGSTLISRYNVQEFLVKVGK